MCQKSLFAYILILVINEALSRKGTVTLKTTSPVALDTPIWFTAEYFPYEADNLEYRFEDSMGNHEEIRVKGPIAEWMFYYDGPTYYSYLGEQTIRCTVYKITWNFPWKLASATTTFLLADSLSATIYVTQPNVTGISDGMISTLNSTNITAVIHDPRGWIRDHTTEAQFTFHIKNQNNSIIHQRAGPCATPSVLLNVTLPGEYNFDAIVGLKLSRNPVTTTTSTTTTTTTTTTTSTTTTTTTTEKPSNETTTVPTTTTTTPPTITSSTTTTTIPPPKPPSYLCIGKNFTKYGDVYSPEILTKYIFAYKSVVAGEPIRHYDITGNTWLKHGEMLLLNATCTGTGPFSFCYNITQDFNNGTDANLPETAFNKSMTQNRLTRHTCLHIRKNHKCQFNIRRYLRWPGMYTLTLVMKNDFSSIVDTVAINVYEDGKNIQLSYIVIPIIFGLLAIVFVLIGVSIYVRNQRRYEVEVADFDFESSDGREYKSFKQVLKEAFYASFTTHEPSHSRFSNVEHPSILEGYD